jgi:2-amino-4-hydroxy-6-hydroxymethyldihydropteridine diphosphokinase
MVDCLISLGANLGDRRENLERAVDLLAKTPGVALVAQSQWLATRPVGDPPGQEEFLNGAVRLSTSLGPAGVLAVLQQIEAQLGRRREAPWGPRTIDLDLLLFGDQTLETSALAVPHPRMAFRRFVLAPAAEIAADMAHPTTGLTVGELALRLDETPNLLAITGPPWVERNALARDVVARFEGRLVAAAEGSDGAWDASPHQRDYDPAGPALEQRLRFLQRQTDPLARDLWPVGSSQLAVSDFWPIEALAAAQAALSGEAMRRFDAQWRAARQAIAPARLVVLVDAAPGEPMGGRGATKPAGGASSAAIDRLRDAFQEWTQEPTGGPVLRLAADDSENLRREIFAAVQAMQ